jgi:hypothetical protein
MRRREAVDDLYLHIVLACAHEQKAHAWPAAGVVNRRGHKNAVFSTLMGLTKRFRAQ